MTRTGRPPLPRKYDEAGQMVVRCSTCLTEKSESSFAPNKTRPNGRQSDCRDCSARKKREWRAANPEEQKVRSKRDREKFPDRWAARGRKWRVDNKARHYAMTLAWRARNPERARANALRNAQVREDRERAQRWGAPYVKTLRADVLARYGTDCYLCGDATTPETLHIDHVVPLSRGGAHHIDNLRPTHALCNAQKGSRLLAQIAA